MVTVASSHRPFLQSQVSGVKSPQLRTTAIYFDCARLRNFVSHGEVFAVVKSVCVCVLISSLAVPRTTFN